MYRRDFIAASTAAAASLHMSSLLRAEEVPVKINQPQIPHWRGFNLTELTGGRRGHRFLESDFAWMAEWGFNFARLPLSYWAWSTSKDTSWTGSCWSC